MLLFFLGAQSHLQIVCRFIKHMIIKFFRFFYFVFFFSLECPVRVMFCIPCVLMCVHVCSFVRSFDRLFICLFVRQSLLYLYNNPIYLVSFTQPTKKNIYIKTLSIARATRTTAHKELKYENVKRQMPYHIWLYV